MRFRFSCLSLSHLKRKALVRIEQRKKRTKVSLFDSRRRTRATRGEDWWKSMKKREGEQGRWRWRFASTHFLFKQFPARISLRTPPPALAPVLSACSVSLFASRAAFRRLARHDPALRSSSAGRRRDAAAAAAREAGSRGPCRRRRRRRSCGASSIVLSFALSSPTRRRRRRSRRRLCSKGAQLPSTGGEDDDGDGDGDDDAFQGRMAATTAATTRL